MVIIADSSPLVALATCSCLALLPALYDDVRVPQSVYDEVTFSGKAHADTLALFLADRIEQIDRQKFVIAAIQLGQGELDAMALYKSVGADKLLIDDRYARRVAEANGIACIGALGILLSGKKQGEISSVKPYLQRLKRSPLYYSERLLLTVLALAGETPFDGMGA